ncbi:MAG: NAD(P)H-hydrate epimerase [Planctomycetes bacterium]|nr:NAD(P)H-hydrate epimerase [Planctomycetota bacterium]
MRLLRNNIERLAVETALVREMDRRTIEDFGVPGAVLMENAGAAVVEIASQMLGACGAVVILAGAGNNAGDGFVTARHLANRGYRMEVITAAARAKYHGNAALNLNIVEKMGLPLSLWDERSRELIEGTDLVIDALLGTGLSGPLRPPYGEIIDAVNAAAAAVLAVDIPSGLDADTGEIVSAAVTAAKTVTFALPKAGLFRGEGPDRAGEVILADIEIPRSVYPRGKVPGGL